MLYYIVASLLFCCCHFSTSKKDNQANNNAHKQVTCSESIPDMKYEETILSIDAAVQNFESANFLFGEEKFVCLYENGKQFKEEAIKFLSSTTATQRQKLICIYSMQGLNLDDYISFAEGAAPLYQEGVINERLMDLIICANIPEKYILVRNYNNPKVKSLLQGITNYPNCSRDLKESIDKILTGETWNEIEEFLRNRG
jgi:hypothetical protein